MSTVPPEILVAEACAVNVRMAERTEAFHREQQLDRELRGEFLLRASRAGATYTQLAEACPDMDARTISNEIREARKRTDDPALKARLPRARTGEFKCPEPDCYGVFTTNQGLALHRFRQQGHQAIPEHAEAS